MKCVIVVILICTTGVTVAEGFLTFDKSEIKTHLDSEIHLQCGYPGRIYECCWISPGGTHYCDSHIKKGFHSGDPEYIGAPSEDEKADNECGIVIEKTLFKYAGQWTCEVVLRNRTTVQESRNVTIKPTTPELEVSSSNGKWQVSEEAESVTKCTVSSAKHYAGIQWYIGGEEVGMDAEKKDTLSKRTDLGNGKCSLTLVIEGYQESLDRYRNHFILLKNSIGEIKEEITFEEDALSGGILALIIILTVLAVSLVGGLTLVAVFWYTRTQPESPCAKCDWLSKAAARVSGKKQQVDDEMEMEK